VPCVSLQEEFWGAGGSGVPEWIPLHDNKQWGGAFYNKSRAELMTAIAFGRVTPKRAVDDIDRQRVHFAGDAHSEWTGMTTPFARL
jgi:hypothetical protein